MICNKISLYLMLFLFSCVSALHAQEAVLSTGGDASGAGGTASYSIGQVVYTTNSGTNGSVAQGVQQSYTISTTIGNELTHINLELRAYPNPTTDLLTLNIDNYDHEKLTYALYDVRGKLVESNQVNSSSTVIKMEGMATSTYFLTVSEGEQLVKTFKIIKN